MSILTTDLKLGNSIVEKYNVGGYESPLVPMIHLIEGFGESDSHSRRR